MTPLESPIEWMFAAAVRDTIDDFLLLQLPPSDLAGVLDAWSSNASHLYACAPQVRCGDHRVDFMFVGYCAELRPALLAVECDGHDFHERTKEQAARDKARDRDLAQMGIHVMRFTGSEINRNAAACVLDVQRFLDVRSSEAMEYCYPTTVAALAKYASEGRA